MSGESKGPDERHALERQTRHTSDAMDGTVPDTFAQADSGLARTG